MFQLSEEQVDNIFGGIRISLYILALGIVVFAISTSYNTELDPYNNICQQMKEQFVGLSKSNCINYLNENPGATGQDILDHYKILTIDQIIENQVDDLLEKPIILIK